MTEVQTTQRIAQLNRRWFYQSNRIRAWFATNRGLFTEEKVFTRIRR